MPRNDESLGFEIRFHYVLSRPVSESDLARLTDRLRAIAVSTFHDRFPDVPVEFEIELRAGSLWGRIKLAARSVPGMIAATSTFLATYGGAVDGAQKLYQHMSWVATQTSAQVERAINEVHGIASQLELELRAGLIAELDAALAEYKAGRASLEQCVTKVKAVFDAIAVSEHRAALTTALVQYINVSYGDDFWRSLQKALGLLPP